MLTGARLRSRTARACAATTLATLATATAAGIGAAAPPDPVGVAIARTLKTQMQSMLRKRVPGLVVTKVVCHPNVDGLPKATCTARFKVEKAFTDGVYTVLVTESTTSRRITWTTTSLRCSDSRTGETFNC